MELTAEQKTRQILTGSPVGEVTFQHEGEQVIRWLTGGLLPDAWVTFHPLGERIVVRCAGCQNILGSLPADRDPDETARAITTIRQAGHESHKPANWPNQT